MAVLLRLCDEDREKWGGPEWVRFDEKALDDVPWTTQYEWEMSGLGISIDFLLKVDWLAKTARGKAGLVWLARAMAGIDTPPLEKFPVNVRRMTFKEDTPEVADADPPGEVPSSEAEVSETESPKSSRSSARSTTKAAATSGQ